MIDFLLLGIDVIHKHPHTNRISGVLRILSTKSTKKAEAAPTRLMKRMLA